MAVVLLPRPSASPIAAPASWFGSSQRWPSLPASACAGRDVRRPSRPFFSPSPPSALGRASVPLPAVADVRPSLGAQGALQRLQLPREAVVEALAAVVTVHANQVAADTTSWDAAGLSHTLQGSRGEEDATPPMHNIHCRAATQRPSLLAELEMIVSVVIGPQHCQNSPVVPTTARHAAAAAVATCPPCHWGSSAASTVG